MRHQFSREWLCPIAMKKIFLLVLLIVSLLVFGAENDPLFNELVSKSGDFVSFTAAGFAATFVPTFAATDNQVVLNDGSYLLGVLILRSERTMDLQVDSTVFIDGVTDRRIDGKLSKVEEPFINLEFPAILPSGGVLAVTAPEPLEEYFMDIKVENILIPWRVRTQVPKSVEMAPVSLSPLSNATDLQPESYVSLSENVADLNDRLGFLQDNVEGLNLQFRRLNTLFLDTQVALAEYKAAVESNSLELEQYASSLESRVFELESLLSSQTAEGELETLNAKIETLNSELAGWTEEVKRISQISLSQSALEERLAELYLSVEELQSLVDSQASSTRDSELLRSVRAEVSSNRESIEFLESDLDELSLKLSDESASTSVFFSQVQSRYEEFLERIDRVEGSVDSLQSYDELLSETLSKNESLLRGTVQELNALKTGTQNALANLQEYNSGMSSQLEKLAARVEQLEFSTLAVEKLKLLLEGQTERLDKLESVALSSSERLSELGENLESLRIELDRLLGNKEGLDQTQSASVTLASAQLQADVSSLKESVNGLSLSFVRLNSDLIQLRDSIPPEGVSPEDFARRAYQVDTKLSELETDLVSIEGKIAGVNSFMARFDEKLETLAVEINSVKGNFDGSVIAIDNNLKSIQKLQTETATLKKTIENIKLELAALKQETLEKLVSKGEIEAIVTGAVEASKKETNDQIASLKRSNNIWLTLAVVSSVAAIVLAIMNMMPTP